MTILERLARLEAYAEVFQYRLDKLVQWDLTLIGLVITGLAGIAILVFKKKD